MHVYTGVLQTNVAKNMKERVSKIKCYMYHGNSVFYDKATIIYEQPILITYIFGFSFSISQVWVLCYELLTNSSVLL